MSMLLAATIVALVGSSVLAVTTCNTAKELEVKIVANYSPPISFSFKPPSYRAGSSLTLSCVVEGVEDDDSGLIYEWRSACEGHCFARGGISRTVSSRYLHSYDQGVHTCIVYDRGGCSGNASIIVNVVGGGLFVESPINEVLPNNSLILASGFHARIPSFRALSGSNTSSVGQLVSPQGNDITYSIFDPFLVSLGNSFDPGSMHVRCFRALGQGEVGIYTYRTPDESGNQIDVNFGIYSSSVSSYPRVTDLEFSLGGDIPFTLTCSSQNSPPTDILWENDGKRLSLNSGYKMSQVLVDRTTSAYVSTLTMDGVLDDVVGEYSCTVVNSIGTSNTLNATIKRMVMS